MKTRTKLLFAGACLQGIVATGAHAEIVVFSDSFNRGTNEKTDFPSAWNPDESGGFPAIVWESDASRAPIKESNGDFLKASREASGLENLVLQTHWFDASPFQGQEYTLSFDFNVGDDPQGRLDLRLQQGDGTAFNGTGVILSEQGSTLGETGHGSGDGGTPRNFDSVAVSEPDANGWRKVTVTGTFFPETLDWAFIEFQPWKTDGDPASGHFRGSYAVDNVRLTVASEADELTRKDDSGFPRAYLITESRGFVHGVVVGDNGPSLVERTFRRLGEKSGYYSLERLESVRHLTASRLAKADLVIFYTSGDLPFSEEGYEVFVSWIRDGGAFVGMHSATDTLPNHPHYPKLIGGTFDGHPWGSGETVTLKVLDMAHPAARPFNRPFSGGYTLQEEIYQFGNFDPENVRVLVSLDMENTELKKPYHVPVSWVREEDQGRVFYSSMGHRNDVWTNLDFQEHLKGGIGWVLGELEGKATPNPDRQVKEEELAKKAYEAAKE